MADIIHGKTNIMNNALRMVGSYHLDAGDTTSVTYEIANQAFNDAVVTIFSENVFTYNTFRKYYDNGVDTTTLSLSEKPGDQWTYRISLPNKGPNNEYGFQQILKVTNKEGNNLLDWYVENLVPANAAVLYDESYYLFTTEKEVHVYYSFVPDLGTSGLKRGDIAANMDAHIVRALTLYMAQSMCIELSGSETRQQSLFQQYVRAIRRARVIEGRGSEPQRYIHDGNSQIISSHYGYGSV
jgi:hypothetical protein